MKQIIIAILIIALIVLITLVILLTKKTVKLESNSEVAASTDVNVSQNSNNEATTSIDDNLSQKLNENEELKSFQEIIKPVNDYLDEYENQYGHIGYINGERFISNARLSKDGDNYKMTFSFISPKLYDKSDIDNAAQEAKQNGSYKYKGYTFYKDRNFSGEFGDFPGYEEVVEEFRFEEANNSIFVTSDEGYVCFFKPISIDNSKCILVHACLPNGIVETDTEEYEISVLLSKDDNILIDIDSGDFSKKNFQGQTKYSIEEYYNKSINKERMLLGSFIDDDVYYEFDLNQIGSTDGYAGLQNAVRLYEDGIYVLLPVLGGI